MKHSDFKMGMEFTTGSKKRWRVTDIGTRTIIAIRIDSVSNIIKGEEAKGQGWFNGPPYAVAEHAFDEYAIEDCEPIE